MHRHWFTERQRRRQFFHGGTKRTHLDAFNAIDLTGDDDENNTVSETRLSLTELPTNSKASIPFFDSDVTFQLTPGGRKGLPNAVSVGKTDAQLDVIIQRISKRCEVPSADLQAIINNIMGLTSQSTQNKIVTERENITIRVYDFLRLRNGEWLNDNLINYYFGMLNTYDHEECQRNPSRRRSHYFPIEFFGMATNNMSGDPGPMNYEQAQKFTQNIRNPSNKRLKVNVFRMGKVFIPVNHGNSHWKLCVVDMRDKTIATYDSLPSVNGNKTVYGHVLNWLNLEHRSLREHFPSEVEGVEFDSDKWTKLDTTKTPTQRNSYDCGMFTLMNASFLTDDIPVFSLYAQDAMPFFRVRVAADILVGDLARYHL